VPEDPGFGATRKLIVGDTERLKCRGNPENRSIGTAERCEIRGDSKIHRRQKPEMWDEGQPEAFIRGVAGGVKNRGNPELHHRQR
jgi:hypothetical protein